MKTGVRARPRVWAAGLAPMGALVRRELVASLRRPRSYLYLVGFVAITSAYLLWIYPTRSVPQSEAEQMSREILRNLTIFLYFLCFLFIPGLSGAAIASERELDTYDLLHVSLIGPTGIFLSKMLNAAGFFLLLLLAVVPAVSPVLFLVGIDWVEFLFLFLTTAVAAIGTAAIGTAVSALFQKNYSAIVTSYLVVLAFQGAGLAMVNGIGFALGEMLKGLSPHAGQYTVFVVSVGYCGLIVGLCLIVATLVLREPRSAPARTAKKAPKPRPDSWHRRLFRSWLDRFGAHEEWRDRLNPVYFKELKLGLAGRPMDLNVVIAYFGFAVVLSTELGYLGPAVLRLKDFTDAGRMIGYPILLHMGLIALVTPAFVAGILAKEVELGQLDMLRTTLLTAGRIVAGKLYFGLTLVGPLALFSLLTCSPLALLAFPSLAGLTSLVAALTSMMVCVALALGLSLLASALTRKTVTAVFASYILLLLVGGGVSGLALMARELGLLSASDGAIAFWSPLYAFFHNAQQSGRHSLLTGYWFYNTLMYGIFALGSLGLAVLVFARRVLEER
jgi:hypothetical protein